MGSSRQLVATHGNGLGLITAFSRLAICDGLPLVATAGLQKGSILRCLCWLRRRLGVKSVVAGLRWHRPLGHRQLVIETPAGQPGCDRDQRDQGTRTGPNERARWAR